ncbi:MAG: hypothetical protein ABI478_07525 [Propionivibrio sp.]
MTSIAAYDFVKSTVKSEYFSASVIFAAWLAALMSGSVLVIVAGLVAYLRPLLLVSLFTQDSAAKEPRKIEADLLSRFSFHNFSLALAR